MSNFSDSIKITDEDKKDVMTWIMIMMLHFPGFVPLEKILEIEDRNVRTFDEEKTRKKIKEVLNEKEILATYSLAKRTKMAILGSHDINRKLLDYLEFDTISFNSEKILKFVNEEVNDMENLKIVNPNAKWSLQINRILLKLEGKDPANGEVLGYEEVKNKGDSNKTSCKIIKFPDQNSNEGRY